MKKPNLKAFAKKAIHTRCDAFMDDEFIVGNLSDNKTVWEAGQEFYPEYSCSPELPEVIPYEGNYMQGIYNCVTANSAKKGSKALLSTCSYFAEIGEEYYVFWCHTIHKTEKYGEQDHFDWCIWTPNTKHYNDRKKEEV